MTKTTATSVGHVFIPSSIDGHSGRFRVPVIVNSAAVNTGVRVSFRIIWFSQGICPVVGLLDHINACMQSLEKMVHRNLFAGQEERLSHRERTCGHHVGRGAWGDQRECH